MPVSSKQLAANRSNAKRSTGPRTPAGKTATSKNATTHGLSSRRFIIEPHQQENFDHFQASLHAEVLPLGALEIDTFQQLLHAAWQLRRADTLEAELHDATAGASTRLDQLERLTRLRATLERSYQRAYRRLRELQAVRAAERKLSRTGALCHSALTPLAAPPKSADFAAANETHSDEQAPFIDWLEAATKATGELPPFPVRSLLGMVASLVPVAPAKRSSRSDTIAAPPSVSLKGQGLSPHNRSI